MYINFFNERCYLYLLNEVTIGWFWWRLSLWNYDVMNNSTEGDQTPGPLNLDKLTSVNDFKVYFMCYNHYVVIIGLIFYLYFTPLKEICKKWNSFLTFIIKSWEKFYSIWHHFKVEIKSLLNAVFGKTVGIIDIFH